MQNPRLPSLAYQAYLKKFENNHEFKNTEKQTQTRFEIVNTDEILIPLENLIVTLEILVSISLDGTIITLLKWQAPSLALARGARALHVAPKPLQKVYVCNPLARRAHLVA
jgi:hypothetical protein